MSAPSPGDETAGGNTGASDDSPGTSGTTLESDGDGVDSAAATGDTTPATSKTVTSIDTSVDETNCVDRTDQTPNRLTSPGTYRGAPTTERKAKPDTTQSTHLSVGETQNQQWPPNKAHHVRNMFTQLRIR
ncbi:hypothetical protein BH09ACT6_BH09ACT6_27460 [soil metagenome]